MKYFACGSKYLVKKLDCIWPFSYFPTYLGAIPMNFYTLLWQPGCQALQILQMPNFNTSSTDQILSYPAQFNSYTSEDDLRSPKQKTVSQRLTFPFWTKNSLYHSKSTIPCNKHCYWPKTIKSVQYKRELNLRIYPPTTLQWQTELSPPAPPH